MASPQMFRTRHLTVKNTYWVSTKYLTSFRIHKKLKFLNNCYMAFGQISTPKTVQYKKHCILDTLWYFCWNNSFCIFRTTNDEVCLESIKQAQSLKDCGITIQAALKSTCTQFNLITDAKLYRQEQNRKSTTSKDTTSPVQCGVNNDGELQSPLKMVIVYSGDRHLYEFQFNELFGTVFIGCRTVFKSCRNYKSKILRL